MSDNLALLPTWAEHLLVTTLDGNNFLRKMDFNRFRYVGVPQTKEISSGSVTSANRDDLALKLFTAITKREDAATATKYIIYQMAIRYLAFCDENEFMPLTQQGVAGFLCHNNTRQRRGEIKDCTETTIRAELSTLLQWLELPAKGWIPLIPTSGTTQLEPTRSYSDSDLKKILPLLRAMFKQLYQQLILEPDRHIRANHYIATMTFDWKGQQYKVKAGVNKLICTATFLMSYYTWCNSSVLFQLKRPQTVSHKLSNEWHQMPAFKRRAFKTLSVEIGSHDHIEVPTYALQFFDQLLHASRLINPEPDGLLLPFINNKGKVEMISGNILQTFKISWLSKHFPMTDARGERLWPVIKRFRATGGQLAITRYDPIVAAQLLDNTPNVVMMAYSSGNPHENNQMNRDTCHTLEQFVRDHQGVKSAKQKVREAQKVEILAYEAYLQHASPLIRNANGSYCKDREGDKADRYTTRARQRGLISEGERLACADLRACWVCEHQVLVETVHDLWCILSFRTCLEESCYLHLDSLHHQQNFGSVIANINSRLKLINHQMLRQAERKLVDEGRHPLWPDAASVSVFSEGKTWH